MSFNAEWTNADALNHNPVTQPMAINGAPYAHGTIAATLGRGELERENAKLRELCGFVLMFTTMTDGCGDTCPYSCNNCQSECYFRKRARELGVEVEQ